jgi:hypothetical protein
VCVFVPLSRVDAVLDALPAASREALAALLPAVEKNCMRTHSRESKSNPHNPRLVPV